jgi:hypothetical protein
VPGSVLMIAITGAPPPAPAGYAYAGNIIAVKNGAILQYALYTKK